MQPILAISTWLSLPSEVRGSLRAIFDIPRSSNTHVDDGRIISDGVTPSDLKSLTIEKMQKYVGSELTDFYKLFDLTYAKVVDDLIPKSVKVELPVSAPITDQQLKEAIVAISNSVGYAPTALATPSKKRGRPAKN